MNVDEIKSKLKNRRGYYTQLHRDQKEIDGFYELDFQAGVPESYPTRMPPTARKWVDVGVNHFTLDNPRARVQPRNDTEVARKEAEAYENFCNFWLWKEKLTIKKAARKLLKRGELFIKVNFDDLYFGTKDPQRLFHWPYFITLPDPINTFSSTAHNGLVPVDVFEEFNITVPEAEEMCRRNNWKWTPRANAKKVKWVTYYDKDVRCFFLDDKPILKDEVQKNILGFCPYVHIDAGFGDEHFEGKPEYQYRSLLWPLRDMLIMEVRNLSQTDAIIGRYAWPRRKLRGESATGLEQAIKQLYPDGKFPTDPEKFIYEVIGQLEYEVEKGETPPTEMFTQQMMLRDYSNPPTVLSGLRPQGVYSGQHQEDLMLTAKSVYKDAFKNLEDALSVTMGMGARIQEKVNKSDLQLKNFASDDKKHVIIKKGDFGGNWDCDVQLLAEPPEANEMRKGLGKAYWQGGAISQETMLQQYFDMSYKETQDEMSRILIEMVMKQPTLLGFAMRDALERLGMDKQLEELRASGELGVEGEPPLNVGEGTNLPPSVQGKGTQAGMTPTPTMGEQQMGAKL